MRAMAVLAAFYDDVLRELLAAVGAALFFGNLAALVRRGHDSERVREQTVARARPGSPVRGQSRPGAPRELARAPLARTVVYLIVGFVVMVAGIASLSM
jgi:hypothetical protein